MKDFLAYFFGKGETAGFTNFTLVHFLPILVMLAVIAYFSNELIGPGANYLFMAKPESTPFDFGHFAAQLCPADFGDGSSCYNLVHTGIPALVFNGQQEKGDNKIMNTRTHRPGDFYQEKATSLLYNFHVIYTLNSLLSFIGKLVFCKLLN